MELVAPAGSFAGLRASINGGADAVYLGMPSFSARAKAENFDEQAFVKAVEYAHLFGVKVFVALNTLIKDAEMPLALDMARFASSAGADAAIVQDLRFIKELKKALPDFTLHASTQLGIHNADGAKVLLDLGIQRAVLARETLPVDIAEIKKTGIQIEYFVQGALCIAFSGNCYFSSLASSYSGNRGKCMQLCRKPYVFHGEHGYFLSAKDLCLYGDLKELESLGVDAIKIEGRMRSEEYAYQAAKIYKSDISVDEAKNALKSVFNRGNYCNGYLSADAPFNVVYSKSQGNIGRSVGKINKISSNNIFVSGFRPHADDGFKVMRNAKEICGASVRKGYIVPDGKCRVGDTLCRTFDGALSEHIKSISRKIDVDVDIVLDPGAKAVVRISCGNSETTVYSEKILPAAVSRAVTEDDVKRVFSKTAEYPFLPHITVTVKGECFMALSEMNELRRSAYKTIYDGIISAYKTVGSVSEYKGLKYNVFDEHGTILMVDDISRLDKRILTLVDYIALNPPDYSHFTVPHVDKPILLNAPVTMRGDDKDIIQNAIDRKDVFGVISNNLYTLGITDKPILLGIGHNIIGDCELPHIRSVEADDLNSGFAYSFGYAPLMTLCHCPYGKCNDCSGSDELRDDSGRIFKLRKYRSAHCYWQLLNCVPNYVPSPRGKQNNDRFFDCTTVNSDIIFKVLTDTYNGEFTRGNINKGLK